MKEGAGGLEEGKDGVCHNVIVVDTNSPVNVADISPPVQLSDEPDDPVINQSSSDLPEAGGPDTPVIRRFARERRPPVRLGDYVLSGGQTVMLLDWQRKVSALLQLMPFFPLHHTEICYAIINVITNR